MKLQNGVLCGILMMIFMFSSRCADSKSTIKSINKKKSESTWVFILAGQSNMWGQGTRLTPFKGKVFTQIPANTVFFSDAKRVTSHLDESHFGPEVTLIHTLGKAYPKQKMIFIKHAIGGTSLSDWRLDYKQKGPLYKQLLAYIAQHTRGKNVAYKGFFWMQGESDTYGPNHNYDTELHRLLRLLRDSLNSPAMKMILGRLHNYTIKPVPVVDILKNIQVIRKKQENILAIVPGSVMVSTDQFKLHDAWHYDNSSQLSLGKCFAEGYLNRTSTNRTVDCIMDPLYNAPPLADKNEYLAGQLALRSDDPVRNKIELKNTIFYLQKDGVAVLYKKKNGSLDLTQHLWASSGSLCSDATTSCSKVVFMLTFQSDGNLVVYSKRRGETEWTLRWESETDGQGKKLVIDSFLGLKILDSSGQVIKHYLRDEMTAKPNTSSAIVWNAHLPDTASSNMAATEMMASKTTASETTASETTASETTVSETTASETTATEMMASETTASETAASETAASEMASSNTSDQDAVVETETTTPTQLQAEPEGVDSDNKIFEVGALSLRSDDSSHHRFDLKNSVLYMQKDGVAVLYLKKNGVIDLTRHLWVSSQPLCSVATTPCSEMVFMIRFQHDGNLVVYSKTKTASTWSPRWNSSTNGRGKQLVVDSFRGIKILDENYHVVQAYRNETVVYPGQDKIINPSFLSIRPVSSASINTRITSEWIVKKAGGSLFTTISDLANGMRAEVDFSDQMGFLYVRQIIPNIQQFENKRITLEVDCTNRSEQSIKYDLYIQSRFNTDNSQRILVTDTPFFVFSQGRQMIRKSFNVPDFSGRQGEGSTEGLSVAFRIVGQNQRGTIDIHSYRLILHEGD